MMYVFDNNSFIVLFNHFYLDRFPSLWKKFDRLIREGRIVSVREAYNEIIRYHDKGNRLVLWAKDNRELFMQPSNEELQFVKKIFSVSHFQTLIDEKKRLAGSPVADPFLIAKAKVEKSCLVTQENHTENAAKIPNVCQHFGIQCTNLEGFMEKEGWQF